MNLKTLEGGVHFLLHSAIYRLLVKWNILLTQMHPSDWHIIMGILTLFDLENCSAFPSPQELVSLIQMVDSKSGKGCYNVKTHLKEKLFEEIPSKTKDWKNKIWFVKGN